MTVNPYFRRNVQGEQSLIESLTTEAIKIHGHEMVYIPRETVSEDKILGEEISKFKDANRIEMYMENAEGFDGESDMTRFGLDIRENCTFVVSRKRFMEVMSHNTTIRDLGRPREGDLIYFDYPYNLFEIKYVEHDNPFYPLGARYSFKLFCEAFKYTQEEIDTGESDMDAVVKATANYTNKLEFSSGVSGGNFIEGEEIYVGATADQQQAYGNVDSWTVPAAGNKYVTVNTVKGPFQIGDVVHGKTSLAQYTILAVSDTDTRASSPNSQDNEAIDLETNRDNIFDFTERDPFSEGNY
jgi:Virus neck protein